MENHGVMILSIAVKVLATCSCFCSLWQVGGTSKLLIGEPNRISLGACRIWLEFIFQKPKRSGVLDNLNTHSPAAFYEAFSPEQARYITKKLEFHYTPEPSSWLNMAEVEISVLKGQCLDRRLGSLEIVANEVGAWETERNATRATIDWRFTIPNARDTLKKLYPVREE
jgi:hypothetical protein